ncbi:MAG TPA: M20/M25/M40 family metallo-hydrolase [Candidatus Thalassarchaeaceae archaeon]|nr:M20/M25/M40 family metallo-hydrolase [Candidatus Thalassarchaeaceae archaeon]
MALILTSSSLSGCLSRMDGQGSIDETDISISPLPLIGAELQTVTFSSTRSMSVFIPYFVLDPNTGFVVNGTILHLSRSDEQSLEMLAPSNTKSAFFLLGEEGREKWPIRDSNQSWPQWFSSEDFFADPHQWIEHPVLRMNRTDASPSEGSLHGTGIIDGLSVFEFMLEFADPDTGFNNLWGPFVPFDPNYEAALDFLEARLSSFGFQTEIHRYLASSSPYAVNLCGYKEGSVFPDEYLVLGAHLDAAEPGSPPGGGTSVGAHDNKAGVALMLEAARGLSQFDHRRTLVVCFWSNEENGYDGVDSWIANIPDGVTVTNYLNADAVGTNWPGYYTLVVDCIPNYDDENIGDQWEMIRMLEWVGVSNNNISGALQLGREIFHDEGYASMKDTDSSDQKRESISVHDSDRGRSDYERFADQLGVVSVDWGSLTGGSDCYHATCDTLDTMVGMMETDNGTGQQNLVESFDLISWWIFSAATILDESPIYDD